MTAPVRALLGADQGADGRALGSLAGQTSAGYPPGRTARDGKKECSNLGLDAVFEDLGGSPHHPPFYHGE